MPTRLEKSFDKVISPFQNFIRDQAVTSVILVLATAVALVMANSSFSNDYRTFFQTPLGIRFADYSLEMSIHKWINDGLMALFFFVIGLEIKRELLVGELRQPAQSTTVLAAAVGGMLAPALIYLLFNMSSQTAQGWGIPMATDTAFVIGVLSLLRKQVPMALVSFVVALAIIDDIGAIIVVALFYTETIHVQSLMVAFLILGAGLLMNLIGIRRPIPYFIAGGFLWLAVHHSGIHATLAGILMAAAVPARPKHDASWFVQRTKKLISLFESKERNKTNRKSILADEDQHEIVENIHLVADKASTPLQRWERSLEQPVALFVLPIFALANANFVIDPESFMERITAPESIGIILGLVVGKFIGITLMTWLALRSGIGKLSESLTLRHIAGIGLLAGMGFTMSIFISNLGFSDLPDISENTKMAVLVASLISGVTGYLWLRYISKAAD